METILAPANADVSTPVSVTAHSSYDLDPIRLDLVAGLTSNPSLTWLDLSGATAVTGQGSVTGTAQAQPAIADAGSWILVTPEFANDPMADIGYTSNAPLITPDYLVAVPPYFSYSSPVTDTNAATGQHYTSPVFTVSLQPGQDGFLTSSGTNTTWLSIVPDSGYTVNDGSDPLHPAGSITADGKGEIKFTLTGDPPNHISYNVDVAATYYAETTLPRVIQAGGQSAAIANADLPMPTGIPISSQFSVAITVANGNHAPVLGNAPSATLPSVTYGSAIPVTNVSTLSADFTDPDASAQSIAITQVSSHLDANNAHLGIIITAVDTAHGGWEFSADGGTTWLTLAAPVHLDPTDQVRFTPTDSIFDGSITNALTYVGWDGTDITRNPDDVVGHESWRQLTVPTYDPQGAISQNSRSIPLVYQTNTATVAITLPPGPVAIVGQQYSALVAASTSRIGGHVQLSLSGLSTDWLNFTNNGDGTGLLQGTPVTAGPLTFTLSAQDSIKGNVASSAITITVIPATITPVTAPTIPKTDDTGAPKYSAIGICTAEGLASFKAAMAGKDATQARAWWWNASSQEYVEFHATDDLASYQALFLVTRVDLPIILDGTPTPMPLALNLLPGWNFLTIPPLTDGTNVSTSHPWNTFQLQDEQGTPVGNPADLLGTPDGAITSTNPYAWNGNSYVQVDPLVTGVGYWFKNNGDKPLRLVRTPGVVTGPGAVAGTPAGARLTSLAAATSTPDAVAASTLIDRGTPPAPPSSNATPPAESSGGGCGLGSGVAGIGLMLFAALRALLLGQRRQR